MSKRLLVSTAWVLAFCLLAARAPVGDAADSATGKKRVAAHAASTRPAPASRPATKPANAAGGDAVTLTPAYVADPKGDGPDGQGNTGDDTWQFWFALAHAQQTFHRLDVPTATLSPQRMQQGVPRKIRGPIAGSLPNPKDTHGWIYHSDWDGRFEGVWGDKKANQVIAYPYVEKNAHCAVAITYRVPRDGTYDVSAKLTDLQIAPHRLHKGILWRVEVVRDRGGKTSPKADRLVGKGGPIGDKVGPDSQAFSFRNIVLKKGELLRLVIDPNKWWGTDMTRIENFTIRSAK